MDIWQILCADCGYIDENGEDISKIFTPCFHINYGNIQIYSENIIVSQFGTIPYSIVNIDFMTHEREDTPKINSSRIQMTKSLMITC